MRAGPERLSARVVQVFGAAQANHGYLFANMRATRIKLLVHDGFGVWCTARRLNQGSLYGRARSLVWSRHWRSRSNNLTLGCWANPGSEWVKCRRLRACYVSLLSTKPS